MVKPHPEPSIDLGDLSVGADYHSGGSRPAFSRQLRTGWQRHRRWPAPLLVLALVLGLGGEVGQFHGARLTVVDLPGEASGGLQVVDGRLLVEHDSGQLTAYDLDSGDRAWQITGGRGLFPTTDGRMLVDPASSVGLEPATGQVRWSRPGLELVPGIDHALSLSGYQRSLGEHGEPIAHELVGVDLVTGEELWEEDVPAGAYAWLLAEPPLVVTISQDRELALRDPATGELQGRGAVASTELLGYGWPAVVAESLVLLQRTDCPDDGASPGPPLRCATVRGYPLDTLRQNWERPAGLFSRVEPCGPVLCLHTVPGPAEAPPAAEDASAPVAGGHRTLGLDPATGEPAWELAHSGFVAPLGDWLLVQLPGGRELALHDLATGEPVLELAGWQWQPLLAGDLRGRTAGHGLALVRGEEPRVATLNLTTLELVVHEMVTGEPERCESFPGGLACQYGQQLWVWRW